MARERALRGYLPRALIAHCMWLAATPSALAQSTEPPPLQPSAAGPIAREVAQDTPIEILVTGSRVEEPLARAASAIEVIARAEIERSGARDAAEVLETRAGLQIVRTFRGSQLQPASTAAYVAAIRLAKETP
jgi:outer membrane receptor protein involved in Fe transport